MKGCHFLVSFEFYDDRPNANTQDFKDELEEKYGQAVLENRAIESICYLCNYAWLETMAPENLKYHWDSKVDSITRKKV